MEYNDGRFFTPKRIVWGIGGVVIIILFFALLPFTIVDAGERGVVLKLGKVDRVLDEGLSWVTPFIEDVEKMDVRTQVENVEASAASKDLQSVHTTIAVNYNLEPARVGELYTTIGKDYKTRVIDPSVQEAIKAATAKYTAEESITKRELVRDDIKTLLLTSISAKAPGLIHVTDVSIVNFEFSKSFDAAIEAKVTAEQRALEAKNQLEQIKFEAEQKIATARAEAESVRLQAAALAQNSQVIELRQLEVQKAFAEKWNGVLPINLYGSAPIPFLQIGK